MAQDNTVAVGDDLSQEEHDRILNEEIIPSYLSDSQPDLAPNEKPRVIVLAGQPGAGKSGLLEITKSDFQEKGAAVTIDVDRMRDYHPGYEKFQVDDDRTAADRVQNDAGDWADELRDEAMIRKHNVIIIDATLKSPKKVEELYRKCQKHGYEMEVRAMAVRKEDSIQGMHGRYERAKEKGLPGRSVPSWVHDEAYDGIPESVAEAEKLGIRTTVYGRGREGTAPKVLYDSNDRSPKGPESPKSAKEAIINERNRDRSPEEIEAYDKKNLIIKNQIFKRNGQHEKEYEDFLKQCDVSQKRLNEKRISPPSPGNAGQARTRTM